MDAAVCRLAMFPRVALPHCACVQVGKQQKCTREKEAQFPSQKEFFYQMFQPLLETAAQKSKRLVQVLLASELC